DLANAGFKVFLVEDTSAIGGVMAQLDKTFPTNDCSMCTISPKLIEVGKHLNINIITNAQVEDVQGGAGNFKALVRKRPRYIDIDKCNACGDCMERCPVEVKSEFDERLINRKAIYKRYPQAIPNVVAIDKLGVSPCKANCPAGIHVQGYVALIGQKKHKEALALIRKHNPLPAICGRVCTHPCESACTRKKVDDPIATMYLKRFIADWEYIQEEPEVLRVEKSREEKVAIVGAGPAGLAAAFYLALEGYQVTIFEATSKAGGMMIWGIPDYRLPREILNKDIEFIQRLGVEIKTNTPVGPELTIENLFSQGFKAIFLGVGAQKSMKLGIEGEDLKGVIHGLDYLREINSGKEVFLGNQVAVIGGGNVAIDVVRTALRNGSKEVFIVYRRSREEMPALEEEIIEAEEEGVKIHYLLAPKRILGKDGKMVGIECIRMELGEPDASGRRRPIPVPGSEFVMEMDAVVPAIGQSIDLSFLPEEKKPNVSKRGGVEVDPVTYATNVPGIFAGGDMVTGPATVVEAIGAGREGAISISRYLQGVDLYAGREKKLPVVDLTPENIKKQPRQNPPKTLVSDRIKNFQEVQKGFTEEEALAEAKRCLNCGVCSECLQCVVACGVGAINHDMKEEVIELNVGSIVLTPGFDKFNPEIKGEYGHGRMKNVVTSIEFERILSASGPYQGHVVRPSDHKEPKKIAWIQCVGSRDSLSGNEYCSSVCCMYATKEAIMAVDHVPGLEATIFYNDIRAFGKGFEFYYESARKNYGVRYIKGIISGVKELQQSNNLLLNFTLDTGEVKEEFDLIVLSVGLVPHPQIVELAKKIGVNLNRFGFCQTQTFTPNQTSRPGIYVAGVFEAPMDIPETVMGSSSAAALAEQLLAEARGTMVQEKTYPMERDISDEEPRVGVFICRCGTNIARVVDVPSVAGYAKSLPFVVHAEENLYTCSTDTQKNIIDTINKYQLNRVVVASCSPRTHEPLFRDTLREAGINKYLFEMANIRDQCSWVHASNPGPATEKAKDLVRMAVARATTLEPVHEIPMPIIQSGLIIGGGIAGMTAALSLAEQGFDAYLVEKEKELGGNFRKLYYTTDGLNPKEFLDGLLKKVTAHPHIKLYTEAEIEELSGYVGKFKTRIRTNGKIEELSHGVVILATGAQEYQPTEYSYGLSDRVLTQRFLEEKLAQGDENFKKVKTVAMIQCVGSRDEKHPYCSRICCTEAVKNALKLKELNPEVNIYILYRDIRTYGFNELHYKEAREKGVVFIRYEVDRKPEVSVGEGRVQVKVFDEILNCPIHINSDYLILSAGIHPRPDCEDLAKKLKLPLNADKFFLEAHMKLRPLDFSNEGFFMAGMAHSPKFVNESIAQARGTAARAATIISKDTRNVGGAISVVDQERCAACLTCVRECPFHVPVITEEGVAYIEPAACQGCGICAGACPRKAIEVQHYKDRQIIAKCESILEPARANAGAL
ncbi:MAG: NAD(P)-binding protein, partial [Pseudomonadota bacterium]